MPENKLTKEDLEALKQCRSKEDIKKYLSSRQLSEDELDMVSGGSWISRWLEYYLRSNDVYVDPGCSISGGGVGGSDTIVGSNGNDSKNFVETTSDKIYED